MMNPVPAQLAVEPTVIPTSTRGLFVAALTALVVGGASLCALAAYRRPAVHPVMASSVRAPAHEVREALAPPAPPAPPAPIADEAALDLDAIVEATARSAPAAESSEPVDATMGVLVIPREAEGHRVWVDGRLVAVVSSRSSVSCGHHVVKLGSRGQVQQVVVPCGGDLAVAFR